MSNDTSFRPGATRNVAYSSTAGTIAVGTVFGKIRVLATTDAFITISPVATSTAATAAYSMPITGKVPEYFNCNPGDVVSFIQQTASGTGYVTDMSIN